MTQMTVTHMLLLMWMSMANQGLEHMLLLVVMLLLKEWRSPARIKNGGMPHPVASNEETIKGVAAPPLTAALNENGQPIPGAYSAPGRAFGALPVWGRRRPVSQSIRTLSVRRHSTTSSSSNTPHQFDAVLVQNSHDENPGVLVEATPVFLFGETTE